MLIKPSWINDKKNQVISAEYYNVSNHIARYVFLRGILVKGYTWTHIDGYMIEDIAMFYRNDMHPEVTPEYWTKDESMFIREVLTYII